MAFEIFTSIGSQWRVGMSGPTGLDYAVLPAMWQLFSVPKKDRSAVFEDLRVLENAALKAMNEKP